MSKNFEIKAQFVGTTSLGYETGKIYPLLVEPLTRFGIDTGRIRICGAGDGQQICEYESLHAFLKNWDSISIADRSEFWNTVRAINSTKHAHVIFTLHKSLGDETEFLKKPSTRFDLKKIASEGITEADLANSRKLAETRIAQFNDTLSLLEKNAFLVGSTDLEKALQEYAKANFSMDPYLFSSAIINLLEKNTTKNAK